MDTKELNSKVKPQPIANLLKKQEKPKEEAKVAPEKPKKVAKEEPAPKKEEKSDKATDMTDAKPAEQPICNGKNRGECEPGTFAKQP